MPGDHLALNYKDKLKNSLRGMRMRPAGEAGGGGEGAERKESREIAPPVVDELSRGVINDLHPLIEHLHLCLPRHD